MITDDSPESRRIQLKLSSMAQAARRQLVAVTLAAAVGGLALFALGEATGLELSLEVYVGATLACLALFLAVGLARQRRLARLPRQPDVVAAYRRELVLTVRLWRSLRFLVPVTAAGVALQLPQALAQARAGLPWGQAKLAIFAAVVVSSCLVLITMHRGARRARRELAELRGGDDPGPRPGGPGAAAGRAL